MKLPGQTKEVASFKRIKGISKVCAMMVYELIKFN